MTEHDDEPVRGLPGHLPPGETMLWQGSPDWLTLARHAFHARAVAIYFALLTALACGLAISRGGGFTGTLATAGCGVAASAILHALAWGSARSTVYTLTDRRIVLRVGVAVQKCVNLPLGLVDAVDLAERSGGGDIALRLAKPSPLGWVALWPHARPWRLARPEPMLRALPDAADVAASIARACRVAQDGGRITAPAAPAQAPALAEPLAA